MLGNSKNNRKSPLLHCETVGESNNPIVFLHGIGGTSRYWKAGAQPLAANYKLIFVDLLGYGQSPKPWTKYTVDRHVDELARVLKDNGPLTIVGHSFGAIAALAFAARYPALVRGLVLMSLPYFGDKEGAMRYFGSRPSADRYLMTNIAFAAIACVMTRRVLRWVLPYVLRDLPREVVQDLVQHTWRSYTSSVWDGIYRHDPLADAERLAAGCPVLLLHGERDTTAPLAGIRQLMAGRPKWDLRVLPGCDHHPLLRDPAWCVEAIESVMGGP